MSKMRWSEEEKELLEKLWPRPDMTAHSISTILVNRTPDAINKEAAKLGITKEIVVKIDYDALEKTGLMEI